MVKIAFVIEKFVDSPPFGGEPYIHLNFIKYLLNLNYEVDIFCEKNMSKTFKFNINDCFFCNKNKYLARLNKKNYDLIISSKFGLKFPDLKADIYTIHSHSAYYSKKLSLGFLYRLFPKIREKVYKEKESLLLNNKKKFVFCSERLLEDYKKLLPANIQSFLIYPYPNNKKLLLKEKIPRNDFTFGISAIGFQNKGGWLILQSACLLKLAGKKFRLKIIYKKTPGVWHIFFVKILGLTNNVDFLLPQSDMSNFYNSIDCLVVPSKLESFGMVAAEAISLNLPVIFSSNCGAVEILNENLQNCIFKFNVFRVFNLLRCMNFIMNSQNYAKIKAELKKIVLNDEKKYNEKLEKIVNEILKQNSSV